jgi:hypothetical protein
MKGVLSAVGVSETFHALLRNHMQGEIAMRPCVTLLLLTLLLLNLLAGCTPGRNQFKGTTGEQGSIAGFWLGLWHGFITPFVFLASLFKADLSIYEVHNNGAWYNFGYLFGLACFFGSGGRGAARRSANKNGQ